MTVFNFFPNFNTTYHLKAGFPDGASGKKPVFQAEKSCNSPQIHLHLSQLPTTSLPRG